jgi:hypothetical protein
LSNNALECSIVIRAASAIKLAELAAARKNHGLTKNYSNEICRIGRYVQKIVHSHKPGKHGSAMTKLYNNAAWHCRARFQLQPEPLCVMCLAEGEVVAARIADHIEPHHNDPIKVWNGKLQSLCARIAREQEEVRGEPQL